MKNVLVTGARSGIGKCIFETLAELPEYFLWDFRGDVRKKENWENECKRVDSPVWAIINCAGIAEAKSIFDIDVKKSVEMYEINCLAILRSIQTFGKRMIEEARLKYKKLESTDAAGHIINITSVSGLTGFTYHAHYCASKWAAHGLSLVAAKELAQHGIKVNCICPSPTDTPMWDKLDKEYSALNGVEVGEMNYMSKQLIKRIGQPSDIASMVKYLISEENKYITGTFVKVCGGNILG